MLVGVAGFDPTFPGSPLFRVVDVDVARSLMAALAPQARPGDDALRVYVEGQPALRDALVGVGGDVVMRALRLEGDLPWCGGKSRTRGGVLCGMSLPVLLLPLSWRSSLLGLALVAATPHGRVDVDAEVDGADDVVAGNALVGHLLGPGCRLVPAFERGRVIGIRLFGVGRGPALQAAGLEDGDVLVQVGGVDLARPEGLLSLSSSSGPLSVTIQRRGQRQQRWVH